MLHAYMDGLNRIDDTVLEHEGGEQSETDADVTELILTMMVMQREIIRLREENKSLKEHLQHVCCADHSATSSQRKKHTISQETKDKWAFYHQRKRSVKEEKQLSDWRAIKRETDELFRGLRNTSEGEIEHA